MAKYSKHRGSARLCSKSERTCDRGSVYQELGELAYCREVVHAYKP